MWINAKKAPFHRNFRGKYDKLQFIVLIGGRVCNPRQQQALNIYL